MIESVWNTGMHILSTMPWPLAAFLVGWIGSVGVTHPLKVGLRRFTTISAERRGLTAWITAVVSALAFATLYARGRPGVAPGDVMLVAVLTGVWSPLAFAGLQKFLRASPEIGKRRGFGWLPDLSGVADWLSGDVGPSKGCEP
jgi:hypothetical protein